MNEYHGIGLAAPQVHESLRIFVAGIEEEDPRTGAIEIVPIAIINPEVTPIGRDLVEDWEGCLEHPRHPRQGAAQPSRARARLRS